LGRSAQVFYYEEKCQGLFFYNVDNNNRTMNTSAPKAAILVFSQSPLNRFVIAEICRKFGVVHLSSTPESTLDILNRKNIQTLVIDQSLADYAFFRNHISSFISIVIIGKEMSVAEERVKEWPLDHFVTSNLVPSTATEKTLSAEQFPLALQYTTMKRLIRTDQEFAAPEKNDVSSLYSEIKDIKHFIQKNVPHRAWKSGSLFRQNTFNLKMKNKRLNIS